MASQPSVGLLSERRVWGNRLDTDYSAAIGTLVAISCPVMALIRPGCEENWKSNAADSSQTKGG